MKLNHRGGIPIKIKPRQLIPFLIAAAWLGMIFFLSSQNGEQTADLSLGIVDVIHRALQSVGIQININHLHHALRTSAHVIVFFVEGILLYWAINGLTERRRVSLISALLVAIPLCALDELHKLPIPGRHCQWDEAALNFVGAALGILVCLTFVSILQRRRRKAGK